MLVFVAPRLMTRRCRILQALSHVYRLRILFHIPFESRRDSWRCLPYILEVYGDLQSTVDLEGQAWQSAFHFPIFYISIYQSFEGIMALTI
jgi:hypothetical protein